MANKLPCPNPTCTHEFAQAELQAASQIACPKCGFRMQGRGAAPAKPAPVKPAAAVKPAAPPKPAAKPAAPPMAQPLPAKTKPVATAPMAQPIPQTKPAAPVATSPLPPLAAPIPAATPAPAPGDEEPAGSFFDPGAIGGTGSLVRQRTKPKRPFNWIRLLVITFVIGFAASVVITAIFLMLTFFLGTEGLPGFVGPQSVDGAIYWYTIAGPNGSEKALKVVVPRDIWDIDKEMVSRLQANTAWKLKEDDLWFAVVVKDYNMQKPRDAEMVKVAVDRLEAHFGDALELAAKAEPTDFGDLKGQKLQFKGQARSANWLGECIMLFKDGIGYWIFIASPEWDKVAALEEEMPSKRIFVAVDRRGWREQPWPTQTFNSEKGQLAMTAPKGVWESFDAKNVEENGILLLHGKYLEQKDNRKNAQLLVFTFDKKDNLEGALTFAREFLEKKEDNENKNFKIEVDDDKGQGKSGAAKNVGNRPGRIIELKRLFNDEPKRYFMLAVVNDPTAAYGILCECSWEHRQIWRQDFLDILGSAKFRKGE